MSMNSSLLVSGLSVAPFDQYNGIYIKTGTLNGRNYYTYNVNGVNTAEIVWNGEESWYLTEGNVAASSTSDVEYPWLATGWFNDGFDPTGLVITEVPVSTEPTFGLPADVVALITSRFGTVANFLRLRNQGQI